jgi:murein DD-endopeptidase MepM/ murein hydrolase activator NlpD
MGDPRDEGKRAHRGIDFSSTYWEPVRAVADGKVVLAGVDRKYKPSLNIDPELAGKFPSKDMGAGGLFVMIRHKNGLLSAYMHLATYRVKHGDTVHAGQAIGTVGRTGVKRSAAHLHFEMRHKGKHIDPLPHLKPYVFTPNDTYIGRRLAIEHRRIKRRHRRLMRKRRKMKVAGIKATRRE